jgi:hypothetical protein
MEALARRETVKFHEALRDCYGIYEHIQSSPEPYAFYDVLRDYFRMQGSVQSNSPDEGLLIRFVFTKKSKKQISEYATVIRYALQTKVSKADFIKWYTTTTQTRILQKARKDGNAQLNERLARARVLLQRYFDIREQWPLGEFDYPAMLAGKQVHLPDDLIIVICVVSVALTEMSSSMVIAPAAPLCRWPQYPPCISYHRPLIWPTISWIGSLVTWNLDWSTLKKRSSKKPNKFGLTI